jgi:hypothetical protein
MRYEADAAEVYPRCPGLVGARWLGRGRGRGDRVRDRCGQVTDIDVDIVVDVDSTSHTPLLAPPLHPSFGLAKSTGRDAVDVVGVGIVDVDVDDGVDAGVDDAQADMIGTGRGQERTRLAPLFSPLNRSGGHGFGTTYRALANVLAGTCGSGAEDKQCNAQRTAELPEKCTAFAFGGHGYWSSQWSPAGRTGPGRGNGGGVQGAVACVSSDTVLHMVAIRGPGRHTVRWPRQRPQRAGTGRCREAWSAALPATSSARTVSLSGWHEASSGSL